MEKDETFFNDKYGTIRVCTFDGSFHEENSCYYGLQESEDDYCNDCDCSDKFKQDREGLLERETIKVLRNKYGIPVLDRD